MYVKANKNKNKYPGKTFPSHSVPNKEKATPEYGLAVAQGIEGEWYSRDGGTTRFFKNRYKYERNRRYAVADQNVQKYKDEFNITGDFSYLNLDFTPVPIAPKFVDIVVNGMSNRDFAIQANAVDQASTEKRENFVKTLKGEMENKDTLMAIQKATGVDVFENDPQSLPENSEELDLYLELNYKQGAEIAIEKAIEFIFKNNKFDDIRYRMDMDLVTLGLAAAKHSFCPVDGVKLEYVDPANLVYSYTESKYLDDCFYFGEAKRVHITEVQKLFPDLTPQQLEEIRESSAVQDRTSTGDQFRDDFDQDFVTLMYFSYKTTENEIYKMAPTKAGGMKATEKDESFNPPGEMVVEKTKRIHETIYEGVSVFGCGTLLKWEKAKNLVRPGYNSPKVMLPYVAVQTKDHRGQVYSLVDRMIKYIDAIQLTHLKMQQVIQRLTPPGVYLDADGLAEIDLGNGNVYNPQEALNMYFATGSVVGRSITEDGNFNHAKIPIQELPGGDGRQLQSLIQIMEYNINQIRLATGLNEARDGSAPDPNALVGVQKLAAANSNTATRHIVMASSYLIKEIASGSALRVKDIIEYSPRKEDFVTAIGKYNTELLEDLKNLHHNEFGVFIELGPDEEEQTILQAAIQAALAKDLLKPEDQVDIMRIKNYKLANQMLKVRREKRERTEQENQKANIDRQNEGLVMVAQKTEEAKAQAAQMKTQGDMQLSQMQSKLKIQEMEAEMQYERQLLFIKHGMDMERLGSEMMHEDTQNDKKNAAASAGRALTENKKNTVDGTIKSPGLI